MPEQERLRAILARICWTRWRWEGEPFDAVEVLRGVVPDCYGAVGEVMVVGWVGRHPDDQRKYRLTDAGRRAARYLGVNYVDAWPQQQVARPTPENVLAWATGLGREVKQ